MRIFHAFCIRCDKELKKGDKVVKFGNFQMYHAECFKKDREEVLRNAGALCENHLSDAHQRIASFKKVVDSKAIAESEIFYEAWGKLSLVIDLFRCVLSDAEHFGLIGFLHKNGLRRKLSLSRDVIIGIGKSYLEDYGEIKVERTMKELYPSSNEPSLQDLREEESNALSRLKQQIEELNNSLEKMYAELKTLSYKIAQKEREEIEKQIRNIPSQTTTF